MLTRIAAILCLGACSFGIQGPVSSFPASTPPSCETSKGRVTADTVIAAASAAAGLGLLADHNGGGAALLLTSALFAGSALIGNRTVDSCRLAMSEYEVAASSAPMRPLARAPVDPYDAPARSAPVVAAPPPAPGHDGDVFHVPLGAARPETEPVPVATPRPPAPDTSWRQFWREGN